jgi:phage tail sheath gpL-like
MIDVSAVARVTGISVEYKDLRGGAVVVLPQQIAVFAQGASDMVYPSTKFQATGYPAVGNKMGYGCPAELIAEEFFPANGDGVGTIPVHFYPLADAPGSTPSIGDITPSGTATKAHTWKVRIAGIGTAEFVVPAGAVSVTNLCALAGDAINAVLKMPFKVSYTYGTVTASALVGTGNGTLTLPAVTPGASPRPGTYTLRLKTVVANGGVWTLRDATGKIVADNITMTPGVGGITAIVNAAGLNFTLTDGTTDFGLNAEFTITVPATKVTLTSKWKGASANGILVEMVGDTSLGVTWAITQPVGGLVNPDITPFLGQVGGVWETQALNALNISDTDTLDKFKDFGEGRWGQLVKKPISVWTGNTAPLVDDATLISDARKDDRINGQLVAPGSPNLPFVVAARELLAIVRIANNSPPTDYGSQPAKGLTGGTDGQQWDYPTKDLAVKRGSSTSSLKDGVIYLSDTVTFFHPTGDPNPAYRYACDIEKLKNILFNLDLIFTAAEWDGAPLVPDAQVVTEPRARKPKHAKAQIASLCDSLGKAAIISNPEEAKASIVANITGPKRLDCSVVVQLSGNTNIKSITLYFGFDFGSVAAAA